MASSVIKPINLSNVIPEGFIEDFKKFSVASVDAGPVSQQLTELESSRYYSSYVNYTINTSLSSYTSDSRNFNISANKLEIITLSTSTTTRSNPAVAVGAAAMGVAISIAIYNYYRRRGPRMMIFMEV